MKFDLEEYKNNNKRKLILRNLTTDGPQFWLVEEIQAGLGDIVIIKVPDRQMDFPAYAPLDKDYNLVHETMGKIGVLEFANRELTLIQFIKELAELPLDCSLDFTCQDNNDAVNFGVTKIIRFDTTILLFAKYGDLYTQTYGICNRIDYEDMVEFLKDFLNGYFSDYIYIDETYTDKELWGVTFEYENVDGLKFRSLAQTFFDTKDQAETWMVRNDIEFDVEFDKDACSNPSAVLIDRWSISPYDNKCRKSI